MRQLGRLVAKINENRDEKLTLSDCLSGQHFDDVVEATKALCKAFDDASGRPLFSNPSIGLKLGHSLVKCARIKKGIAVRTRDVILGHDADSFLSLHKADWTDRVSSASLASLKRRRYHNPDILPLTSDHLKLKEFQSSENS